MSSVLLDNPPKKEALLTNPASITSPSAPTPTTSSKLKPSKSLNDNEWVFRKKDSYLVQAIKQKHDVPLIVAELLAVRDINPEEVEDFLDPKLKSSLPNPSELKDMDKAAKRVVQALVNQEKIVIYGDYDVDGATSSALLKRFFGSAGLDVEVYIPDRMTEGYGPNKEAFLNLRKHGADLIITVDCGTTAFETIEAANEAGLDVIVIDHHLGADTNPAAYAIVNPNRLDESSGNLGNLAAVGVSFLFAVAINRELRKYNWYQDRKIEEPNLLSLLDLVALGTICDVVSLTGINRAFVFQGLKILKKRQNIGISKLIDIANISETPGVYHLGFIIGPRINAGGRIGKSNLGSKLLATNDEIEAATIANELDRLNLERRSIEFGIMEEAKLQAESQKDLPVIIIKSKTWHQGVIGIACSRIKEEYYRPVISIAVSDEGIGKASGRSITGIDLGAALLNAKAKGLLITGGGHAMAAGFTIKEENIKELHDYLISKLGEGITNLTHNKKLHIDAAISISGINNNIAENINRIGPFGNGNHEPVFALENINVIKHFPVGANHIKCIITDNPASPTKSTATAIAFRHQETKIGKALRTPGAKLHIAGHIRQNHWNGNTKAEFVINDVVEGSYE